MIKEKQVIKIQLDYLQGPIWISDAETGEPMTGIELIDSDTVLKALNYQASHMYSAYYEFNSHDTPCWFNLEKEKEEKEVLLDLISQIVARLNEINDGSFVVEDLETDRLLAL